MEFSIIQNLINKKSWYYYYKFNQRVSFEDIQAQGFLIYCEALETYDQTKAKFITYLYPKLSGLHDYCLRFLGKFDVYDNDISEYFVGITDERIAKTVEFFVDIEKSLSEDAQDLLDYLFTFKFNTAKVVKDEDGYNYVYPGVRVLQKELKEIKGWKHYRTLCVINEIKEWYRTTA